MALNDYLFKKLGVQTKANINPVVSSVGTSATKILNNNPDRLAWILINLGTEEIYVAFESDVSSNKGILVDKNGGFLVLTVDEDFHLVGYEVWAISPSTTNNIYIVEVEAV